MSNEKKGITVKIDADLHAEIKQYIESQGGFGGKTGLYDINAPVKIRTADGVKLVYPPIRHGRKYSFIDMNSPPNLTEIARCITARQDSGISNRKGEHSGVFIEDEPRAILTPERVTVRQRGRRYKEPNEPMFALTVCDRHGIIRHGKAFPQARGERQGILVLFSPYSKCKQMQKQTSERADGL